MNRKVLSLLLILSLLLSSVSPAAAFAEEGSSKITSQSEAKVKKKKVKSTVEWVADEVNENQIEDKDPSEIPDLTDDEIREMSWDQLPVADAIEIYHQFDRTTLQIASYFYSNLDRFLSHEERLETSKWQDIEVMKKIEALPQERFAKIQSLTPAIGTIYSEWKSNSSTGTVKALTSSVPPEVKYTEKEQKWNYATENSANPVNDLYREANVVETDLVLEGKHGLDLVLQRSYHSMNSKVLWPGYGEDDNVTYKKKVANDEIPFAAGWDFNIPSFSFISQELTTAYENFRDSERYSADTAWFEFTRFKWFINLDDGTSYERNGLSGWKNYPYKGLDFTYDSDGLHARLIKNGITYIYDLETQNGGSVTITKSNPQGDKIKYWIPSTNSNIEITDSVGRVVVLRKNGPYGGISDLEVYSDSSKQNLIKHIHYDMTAMTDYLQLDRVTEISPINETKIVSEYQYHDPNILGKAEFNYNRSYDLPKNDNNGIDSQTYINRDNQYRDEIKYLLLKEASYPVQGLKMNYKYGTYNPNANMLQRGVVRLYQDDYAISYISYHPVTSVTYSYMPMNPNPVDSAVYQTSFSRNYEMVSPEIWKVPKSMILRLASVASRNGDRIVSKEQPTGQLGYLFENTYTVNPQGNHLLSLVKQTAAAPGTVLNDGGKQYKYIPITYTSYHYQNNNVKPNYEQTFVDAQGTSVNQNVYNYLLHNTVVRPSDSEIDNYANETYREYDDYGDITYEEDPQGNDTSWEYLNVSAGFRLPSAIKSQANDNPNHYKQTIYTYNADHLLESETIEDSYPGKEYTDKVIRNYTYQNKLLSKLEETSYGAEQKTLTKTFPAYDRFGLHPTTAIVQVKLATGQSETALTTMYEYDDLGQLKSQSYPDGSQVGYSYDLLGRMKYEGFVASNGDFRITQYEYDDSKRKVTKLLPDDTKIVTVFTPFGDTEYQAQIGTNGQERPLLFNKYMIDGKHLDKSYPYALPERKISYSYNADGSLNSKTDPIGTTYYARTNVSIYGTKYIPESSTVERQPNGLEQYIFTNRYGNQSKQLAKTGDGLQQVITEFDYDAFSNPTRKKETSQSGESRTWQYKYDLRGKPINIIDPESNVYGYGYDSLGNLVTLNENNTLTTRYGYNSLSLKLKEEYVPSGAQETFSYNEVGNVKQFVDKSGNRHEYVYTPFYDVQSITTKNSSGSVTNKETREYDPHNSLLLTLTNSNGSGTANNREIEYTYDAFNRMDSQTAFNRTYTIRYTDSDELMDKLTYPDNTAVSYTYDSAGRLTQVSSGVSGSITYDYNTTSTGEVITLTYPNEVEMEQKLDSFGQINKLNHLKDGNLTWDESTEYNFGNITTINRNSQTFSYEYDKIDRLDSETTPSVSNTYTYDERGNRQSFDGSLPEDGSSTSLTFDGLNRLRSFKNKTTNDKLDYTYYADGFRATKIENEDETKYVYLNGKVIEELDGSGNAIAQNIWGNGLLFRKDFNTNQKGYYGLNSHGDVVSVTDAAGNELNHYDYDSWGNLISQTEGMANPFKYSGEIYDEKTGFYYLRARYYDPSIGRFISEDSYKGQVDNPLSLNRYTYTHNNPLKFVDPSGHEVEIGASSINRPGDTLFDDKKREAMLDIYKRYGLEAVPEMYRDEVQIFSGDALPGSAGVRIVRGVGKAVITAINGVKVANNVLNTSTSSFRNGALTHIIEGANGGGFHWLPGSTGAARIVQGTKSTPNQFGVYTAQVEFNGVLKSGNGGYSTFFPDNWSKDQVINAINEAYSNKAFLNGNTYEGVTQAGMKIGMYLDNAGKIISAFPKY
ncbi:RHS repeat-associated core domain-containing protein [Brevibacillus choshinensis]|uniref:EndoU domain-containing protein n=1 Tax=Brevibacillus choshinensis TaxID=54911 RepID=A0ABX7FHL1_BRECH|nr:RHS repeat-associated core domain-containing protein [Brevibacillus choshinensis]QRG65229.1 EndoU domain-containing protein [Brevibacillus choshinensis]